MTALGATLEGQARLDGAPLFAHLRLDLRPGQWTCLLGGSGVGKTTLLRLIAGLPTGADFDGRIAASDGGALAERVAYMAQDDLLLPWASVAQNVALGARLRGTPPDRGRIADLLGRVGLADHAAKRPASLSGGQRQRAALARTLMEEKPVILLDEPFSALDAQTRARMQDLAASLLAERTVLMVTHDPGEAARLGEAIYIMTPAHLSRFEAPAAPIPRSISALETLRCQSDLLGALMEPAS